MKTQRTWVIPERDRGSLQNSVLRAIMEAPEGYTVKIGAADKSSSQRAMFHIICEEIGKELGNSPSEIKTAIKIWHYGLDERLVGKNWYRILRSTEQDDKAQYSDLIEAAYRWRMENGI